jgi:hypothetical protein
MENDGMRCIDEDGVARDFVGLSSDFIRNNKQNMHSGDVFRASSGNKRNSPNRNEIVVNQGATISMERRSVGNGNGNGNDNGNGNGLENGGGRCRRLVYASKLVGVSTVLVVYVTSNDSTPTHDFTTVVNEILGTDNINLVRR